jgi:hypothetical protein
MIGERHVYPAEEVFIGPVGSGVGLSILKNICQYLEFVTWSMLFGYKITIL